MVVPTAAGATGTQTPTIQLDCPSAPTEVNADYNCRYQVDNDDSATGATIVLSIHKGAGGTFPGGCTLEPDNGDEVCFPTFVPSGAPAPTGPAGAPNEPGQDELEAYFPGDAQYAADADYFYVSVLGPTETSVSCGTPVATGTATTCTGTVGGQYLTKNIYFVTGGTGTFSPAANCTPSDIGGGQVACSVTYTPSGAGSATREDEIYASYDGYPDDPVNSGSNGNTEVSVTAATPPPMPAITSLAPKKGPKAGGTPVVITGSGFTGASAVSFGSNSASSYTVNSDTQITAKAPAGTGKVRVEVVTPVGTTPAVSADFYKYVKPPTVNGVAPKKGPAAGGTSVVITGTNFTGATKVLFGTVAATSFKVDSATEITAVAPAHATGKVNIVISTPGGKSATSNKDAYTYD